LYKLTQQIAAVIARHYTEALGRVVARTSYNEIEFESLRGATAIIMKLSPSMPAAWLLGTVVLLVAADNGHKSSSTTTPKSAKPPTHISKSARTPKVLVIQQDFDLQADKQVDVRTEQAPVSRDANGRPRRLSGQALEDLEGTDSFTPGYASNFSALKVGQTVRVLYGKPAGDTASSRKVSDKPSAELLGTLSHLDAGKNKLSIRTQSLALYGTAQRQHSSKNTLQEMLADHKMRTILVVSSSAPGN
jgi:hypothetical protein